MLVAANIFQPLIDVFEAVLKAIHSTIGGSWGWSIVLLTILIRAILLPLTVKQFHSMQRLQRLQPELKAIQTKYKQDKQRQQQELMKFYKENQVNPLGSCLPLVAQLPVFISLFYMLRTSLRVDICPQVQPNAHLVNGHWVGLSKAHTVPCGPHNGAGFLFIPDLTNKATGAVLVVLVILYVGTQLASSIMMSSPTMDQTQRRIMMFLPLFFVVFIINFPAGVLVYWITTNAWTMGQQYVIKRRLGPVTPAPAAGGDGGSGPGGGGSGRGRPASAPAVVPPPEKNGANGVSGGGLAGLLRGRSKQDESPAVGAGNRSRGSAPPPPPRKKKKRSGRRR
jgi:YidC/Oxa1 family membrane protein insertase